AMADRSRNRRRLSGRGCRGARRSSCAGGAAGGLKRGILSSGGSCGPFEGTGRYPPRASQPVRSHPLPRFIVRSCVLVAVAGLLSACIGGHDSGSIPSPLATPPPSTTRPTPPALPASPPPTAGALGATCQGGWETPGRGSSLWKQPLAMIQRTTGERGQLVVVDMRTFVGPESPPEDKNYLQDIRRWYVKAYAHADPAFQGRFLVERRRFGEGVVSVAPYDTAGFASPNWVGFQFRSEDPHRVT